MNHYFFISVCFIFIGVTGVFGCSKDADLQEVELVGGDGDADSDTDSDTDSDDNSDNDTDSSNDSTNNLGSGFYFIAGDWHGYGESSVGEVEGGTISSVSGDFTSGENQICVEGTLAENYSSLGELGMNVNQDEGSDTANTWTPGDDYTGVYVNFSKNIDTYIRLVFVGNDGNSYCAENVREGGVLVRWNSFKTECWGTGGSAYNPTVGFSKIQLYAPGDVNSAVDFDYCLLELYPMRAEDDTDTGPDPGAFFVGNITTGYQIRSDFLQYWDQITPENEGKWASVEGNRDNYNWGTVDAIYAFTRDNNIAFKQHTFVWGAQSPNWVYDLQGAEAADEIEEWIHDFCQRYPDTELIDVVNEATPGHQPAAYAQSAYGNDWITRVFEIAQDECPNSVLILNDYNVLSWNTNEFIQMATPAVNASVVDAIGLQAHGLEGWSLNDLSSKLGQIANLGLPIYVSEYDVARTDDQTQLNIMQQQFPLFYEHPQMAGITLWGYVLGSTWVEGSGLIRSDGSHRPAMDWLMNYLER